MNTKVPTVKRVAHRAPVIVSIRKATNSGLKTLRQAARKVPSTVSSATARKSKIGYKNL